MRKPFELEELKFMSAQDAFSPMYDRINPHLEDDMDATFDTDDVGVVDDIFTTNFEYNIFDTLPNCGPDN